MPMLAFLPWLHVGSPIVEGPFHVFPQVVGEDSPSGVTSMVSAQVIGRVLSQYRQSTNIPLRVIAVLQYDGRPLGAEYDEDDRAAIFRFGQHLAISGLSDRRFIGGFTDGYTASGHYQVIIQAFTEPFSGSISLTHRRKDGQSKVLMGQSDVHFVRPGHLVSQGRPNLNLRLLHALQAIQRLPATAREHIDASIVQFLLANTDSPDVSLDVESIAIYASLERVTDSTQRLDDIQAKLPAILSLAKGSPWTAYLRRELGLPSSSAWALLREWLKQVYALRGNVAHGKPAHRAPQHWSQQDHLIAGSFVYPLVLKCLLAQHLLYSLCDEDVAWVLGLEKLLGDRPFFGVPPAQELEKVAAPNASYLRATDRSRMTRWQRQFDDINHALLSLTMSQAIEVAIDKVECQAGSGDAPQ